MQGRGPSGAPPCGGYAAVWGPIGALLLAPPPGGPPVCGTIGLPFFAARHVVMLRLMRLATHYGHSWIQRLRAPARMRRG